MKIKLLLFSIFLFSGCAFSANQLADNLAGREESFWDSYGTTAIAPVFTAGKNIMIRGSNKYINFDTTAGSAGYGIRDNGGTIEIKNSGGAWGAPGSVFTGVLNDISDVSTTSPTNWGNLLMWNGTAWTNRATSTLGLTATGAFLLYQWYATTSAPQLTTLANVTDVGTIAKLDYTRASGTLISFTTAYGTLQGASTDLTCTDCLNATEIEDIYVLTAGDTMTGDLTMATTKKINLGTGTANITNNAGRIRIDAGSDTLELINATEIFYDHASPVISLWSDSDRTLTIKNDGAGAGNVEVDDALTVGTKLTTTYASSTGLTSTSIWGTLYGSATDLTCTDCLNATEIEDIYLLDDGDTGTGVYDFGGADSFEIVNGTAPTTDATGEIAVDTTESQVEYFDGTASRILDSRNRMCFSFSSSTPIISGADFWVGSAPYDITFYDQEAKVNEGTSLVINIGDGTNDMGSLTASTTSNINVTGANNAFTKGEDIEIEFGTNTGSVLGGFWCGSYRIDSK